MQEPYSRSRAPGRSILLRSLGAVLKSPDGGLVGGGANVECLDDVAWQETFLEDNQTKRTNLSRQQDCTEEPSQVFWQKQSSQRLGRCLLTEHSCR